MDLSIPPIDLGIDFNEAVRNGAIILAKRENPYTVEIMRDPDRRFRHNRLISETAKRIASERANEALTAYYELRQEEVERRRIEREAEAAERRQEDIKRFTCPICHSYDRSTSRRQALDRRYIHSCLACAEVANACILDAWRTRDREIAVRTALDL